MDNHKLASKADDKVSSKASDKGIATAILAASSKEEQAAQKAAEAYLALATEELAEEGADPAPEADRTERTAGSVLTELQGASESDATPELLACADHPPASWSGVITELRTRLFKLSGEAAAKAEEASESGRQAAFTACEDARRRTGLAIDGNRPNAKRAKTLRTKILAGRSVNSTRPGWDTEINLMLSAIAALPNAPAAVLAMVPILQAGLEKVKALPVSVPGRPLKDPPPPIEVQQGALALSLALGDLLSWSASKAAPKRREALTRIIASRRRSDRPGDPEDQKPPETPATPPTNAAPTTTPTPPAAPVAPVPPVEGAATPGEAPK